ncbi:hypothetical protein ACLOJK_006836 [Asimina triloba]
MTIDSAPLHPIRPSDPGQQLRLNSASSSTRSQTQQPPSAYQTHHQLHDWPSSIFPNVEQHPVTIRPILLARSSQAPCIAADNISVVRPASTHHDQTMASSMSHHPSQIWQYRQLRTHVTPTSNMPTIAGIAPFTACHSNTAHHINGHDSSIHQILI